MKEVILFAVLMYLTRAAWAGRKWCGSGRANELLAPKGTGAEEHDVKLMGIAPAKARKA